MKYSILVTAYDPKGILGNMTADCLASIAKNSAGQDYELILDTGPQPGLFAAYNRLFKKATGEYCIVVPNDTVIESNDWLQQLAVPGTITSWHLGKFGLTGHTEPDGGVTCYPRDVFDRVGWYDERFDDGYGFGDNDWFMRAHNLNIPLAKADVKLHHNGNTTYKTYWPEERQAMYDRCEKLFKEKWNIK